MIYYFPERTTLFEILRCIITFKKNNPAHVKRERREIERVKLRIKERTESTTVMGNVIFKISSD